MPIDARPSAFALRKKNILFLFQTQGVIVAPKTAFSNVSIRRSRSRATMRVFGDDGISIYIAYISRRFRKPKQARSLSLSRVAQSRRGSGEDSRYLRRCNSLHPTTSSRRTNYRDPVVRVFLSRTTTVDWLCVGTPRVVAKTVSKTTDRKHSTQHMQSPKLSFNVTCQLRGGGNISETR